MTLAKLEYGKSITDACIGWDHSLEVLEVLSDAVKARAALTPVVTSAA